MELLENIEYFDLVHEIREIDGEQLKFDRTYQEDTVSLMFLYRRHYRPAQDRSKNTSQRNIRCQRSQNLLQEVFNSERSLFLFSECSISCHRCLSYRASLIYVGGKSGNDHALWLPRLKRIFSNLEHCRTLQSNSDDRCSHRLCSLTEHPPNGQDISSLEYCMCGSAPFPTALYREFANYIDAEVIEAYGLTEGTCISSGTPPGIKEQK